MNGEELDQRMNSMWKKVSGADYAPGGPSLPADVSSSNAGTIRFLRDNFSKAEDKWKTLLAAKDEQLRELSARLDDTTLHLEDLRQRLQDARESVLNQEMASALNLEEAKKMLDAQRANHAKETALLKEVLERTKTEMVSLQERIDVLRKERDSWRTKSDGLGAEKADVEDKKAGLEARLGESKEAVEKTLGELLAERRLRRDEQVKAKELEARIKDLSVQLEGVKTNWDAERTQWRELWDRERSVWETHRQEFAVWEERLRSEREAWTLKMREQEARGVQNASGLADVLKESSAWSEKVTQILKLYALKGVELPSVFVSAPSPNAGRKAAAGAARVLALALAALLVMGGGAWQLNAYRSRVHYTLLSRSPVDQPNPSGLAITKDGVWLADWEKGVSLKDAADLATVKLLPAPAGTPLRYGALSASDGGLWALDMAQLRYVRRAFADGALLDSAKTPGPAPQGAAWDGYNLWAFDAASGLVYKYALDPASGASSSYELEGVKSLVCMQWSGGRLWVLDSKNNLRRYALENGAFKQLSSQAFGPSSPAAFWVDGGTLWTLERSGKLDRGYEIRKYSLKTYI